MSLRSCLTCTFMDILNIVHEFNLWAFLCTTFSPWNILLNLPHVKFLLGIWKTAKNKDLSGTTVSCNVYVCSVLFDSLRLYGLQPARFLCTWNFPGKNNGVVFTSYSKGCSWPRDQPCVSCVSCIGRPILYHYANWEALLVIYARLWVLSWSIGNNLQNTQLLNKFSLENFRFSPFFVIICIYYSPGRTTPKSIHPLIFSSIKHTALHKKYIHKCMLKK